MTWFSTAPWLIQSPWMLFALFSLIVPLVIHLLSKSKGKLIPFGNIRLIQLSKPVRMNEIRLVEPLLLLCRLLLLLLSVLLLAQLYYDNRSQNQASVENNILVTKDWLNHASERELQQLALKAQNDVVYLLAAKNKRLTHELIMAWQSSQNANALQISQQNTWLLVSHYVKTLPNNTNVNVYSTNRLSQFVGDKVYLPNNVSWQIKQLPDDKLTQALRLIKNKTLSIIIIVDDASRDDTTYVNAALSIIKNTKLKNLNFIIQNDINSNQFIKAEHYDWIFYLSSAPISKSIKAAVNQGSKLMAEESHSKNNHISHVINWKEQSRKISFPQTLMSTLLSDSIDNYQRQQQLTNEQIESQLTRKTITQSTNEPTLLLLKAQFKNPFIDKLLILLLIFFWSIERLLSEKVKKITVHNSATSSSVVQGAK